MAASRFLCKTCERHLHESLRNTSATVQLRRSIATPESSPNSKYRLYRKLPFIFEAASYAPFSAHSGANPKPFGPVSRQSFSSVAQKRQAIINPRKDEDGKDMDVEITPRAAEV